MKKNILLVLLAVFTMSCSKDIVKTVEITNISTIDRVNEIVEVAWNSISLFNVDSIIVLDEAGMQVPSQVLYNGEEMPQSLIFSATVGASSKVTYTIQKGTPQEFSQLTFGRQVPERKDDFAWENDRVAFRIYGPALAPENPSNGVDMWLKRTDSLIVDKFYENDLIKGLSYHIDHGQGLDCYKVGHTLGAGAIAPFVDGKILVQGFYNTVKILDCGVLRTSFEVTYDSIAIADKVLEEKLIVSIDAGSQLNKAVVSYDGDFETMQLASGIFLHAELGNLSLNQESGTIAYAENRSDGTGDIGRVYLGLVFPTPLQEIFQDSEHIAGISAYTKGQPFTYYFGGGWSQWGFETDEDWFDYVALSCQKIKQPLKIELK